MQGKGEWHVIVPGLCGPLAQMPSLQQHPILARWIKTLARAAHCEQRGENSGDFHTVLNKIFSLNVAQDFPSAAFTLLSAHEMRPGYFYMHADPVHLRADRDHAILTSSADFEISDEEASVFCASLNRHFNEDGLRFFYTDSKHWFVESRRPISLQTTSLAFAVARNINLLLPKGDDARRWKQVLNESQMLLFASALNSQREENGQVAINSLWFHGAGELPVTTDCPMMSVCSNEPLLQGIACHTGAEYLSLPDTASGYIDFLSDQATGGRHVLHLSDLEHCANYTDITPWLDALADILESWIYPLLNRAADNKADLILYPSDGGRFRFDGKERYRVWRRATVDKYISVFGAVNSE